MKLKNEIGTKFYRVKYQGTLTEMEITGYNKEVPIYGLTQLTRHTSYNHEFITEEGSCGTQSFPLQIVLDSSEDFFDNLKDAKKRSLERFEKEVAPNADYRVARYFDDHFEQYMTGILTKKEAKIQCNKFNSGPRHYVSYSINKV